LDRGSLNKMKIKKQVASLKLSKKLKELGVKQESLFYWVRVVENRKESFVGPEYNLFLQSRNKKDRVSAFTVAELGEILPKSIVVGKKKYWLQFEIQELQDGWSCQYKSFPRAVKFFEEKTMANAGAKMLIYLIENKLVPAENRPEKTATPALGSLKK